MSSFYTHDRDYFQNRRLVTRLTGLCGKNFLALDPDHGLIVIDDYLIPSMFALIDCITNTKDIASDKKIDQVRFLIDAFYQNTTAITDEEKQTLWRAVKTLISQYYDQYLTSWEKISTIE